MTLHEIGDIIRERTARSSRLQALDLLDALAHFASVERDGQKQQVPVGEVKVGDIVIVYPGEQIPVDGEVLRGKALIDQQKLTGESVPVVREAGQTVFASTLVREGEIYIKAQRVGADTRAGASIKLVEEAPVYDTRMENYAAKIADKAIVPALLLSGGVWAATGSPARAASILTPKLSDFGQLFADFCRLQRRIPRRAAAHRSPAKRKPVGYRKTASRVRHGNSPADWRLPEKSFRCSQRSWGSLESSLRRSVSRKKGRDCAEVA